MPIEFPITVTEIDCDDNSEAIHEKLLLGGKCGDMVAVRPCGKEYGDKTYLGVLLGEVAMSVSCRFDAEAGKLTLFQSYHNPAMYVPDLKKVIYGCGSWWGKINNEDDLKQITNQDISNVWYVKAMKALMHDDESKNTTEPDPVKRDCADDCDCADDKEDTPSTTLEELLRMTVESEDAEGNLIQITPEFRLSVQEVRPNGGGVRFLIHANGHNSDTLDFKVYGDTVLVIPPPQPVKCDCADGNAGEVCEDPECVGCRNNPAPVKQPESGRHVNQVYSHANTGIEFTIKGAWDGKYPERNHAFLIRSDGTGHAYIGATTKVASVWDISEEEFHTMTGGRPEWFSLVSGVPQYKKGLTPTSELTEPPPQRSFEERLLGAVRDVAKQHTVEELGLMGNDADGADYAGAYDIMIMAAREVLKEQ